MLTNLDMRNHKTQGKFASSLINKIKNNELYNGNLKNTSGLSNSKYGSKKTININTKRDKCKLNYNHFFYKNE